MSAERRGDVRAVVIGCGNIAGRYDEMKKDGGCYSHAGAYRLTPGVELVAAADPDSERLAAFGSYWKVDHLYADFRELLRRHKAEIVSVCVPDSLHEEVITEALTFRPRVVFAEKPLAMSRHAARTLVDKARAVGAEIVVNNQRRWEEGHRQAAALVARGGIGDVVAATVFYVKGLYHTGCTAVDTIRLLAGEVDAVQALHGTHAPTPPNDPSVDAALYLRNGATAFILGADRYGYRYSMLEIDVLGTAGRIRVLDHGDRILVSQVREYKHYSGFSELIEDPTLTVTTNMGQALPIAMRQIVDFAAGRGPNLEDTQEEAYRDLCVIDAIAESRSQDCRRVAVVA